MHQHNVWLSKQTRAEVSIRTAATKALCLALTPTKILEPITLELYIS